MRFLQSLLRRLRSLRTKDLSNAELSEELRFHLEHQTEENIARGMTPTEARKAALTEFGSVAQITEGCYEARGISWFEDFIQDLRYGLRTLLKNRSFALITIFTLALGIGACTAIFSLVNAVLIRSLPYGRPEKLVYVRTPNPRWGAFSDAFTPTNADFFDIEKQNHSFQEMTLFSQSTYNLGFEDRTERVGAAKVDNHFFSVLQVSPIFGRVFGTNDEQQGNDHVVVIGHALWQDMFGGAADILGRTLRLDGQSYQVIGVMPQDFGFPHKSDFKFSNSHIEATQIWIPSALTAQQRADRQQSFGCTLARLKDGISLREAQAEMSAMMSRLDLLRDSDNRGWRARVIPLLNSALGPVEPLMWLLLGAVGLVLLIACSNAANLLLARAAVRTQELGVRATLGARRSRLVRQMLTESLLLGGAAGTIGIGLAFFFLQILLKCSPGDIPRIQTATLDLHVLLFLTSVTVLTSVLFGILPSLSASRIHLVDFLKGSGMHKILGERKQLRNSLVIAQIALVIVLLTGTGLIVRSYIKVLSEPRGYSASTISADVQLNPPLTAHQSNPSYDSAQKQITFFKNLLARIEAIQDIQAAGIVNSLPLSNLEDMTSVEVEGLPSPKARATPDQLVEQRCISPNYLTTMQIPLLAGRTFTDGDGPDRPGVAIVNEAFVRKYFGNANPIGHQIRRAKNTPWITIVGVVGDIRNMSLESSALPQVYVPLWQGLQGGDLINTGYITVRSSLPADTAVREIRNAVRSIDPDLSIADVHSMGALVSQATARRRFQTTLLTTFSGTALLLAVVGIYGLLTYAVHQRTGEIGLRMALGASKTDVMRLILQEGLKLLIVGLLIGFSVSAALVRLLTGFLYQVPAFDPITFSLAPALLLLATLVASLIPSYRAATVDPIRALRHE